MKVLNQYKNGNVTVTIHDDGTKIREWPSGEDPHTTEMEHCDIKITNMCSLGDKFDNNGNLLKKSRTCEFCHEMSNNIGKHADLDFIEKIWDNQLQGTELAVGGGNILEHPHINQFLSNLSRKGFFPNVTINCLHLRPHIKQIKELQMDKCFYGMGISYRGAQFLKTLPLDISYKNAIFHMILGINNFDDCRSVIGWCNANNIAPKILLLGYKQYGNGVGYYSSDLQEKINDWKIDINRLMSINGLTISFDNLAINQLNLRNYLSEEEWKTFFLGDDGVVSLYCDAVEQQFAKSSTSYKKYSMSEIQSPSEMMKIIHDEMAHQEQLIDSL